MPISYQSSKTGNPINGTAEDDFLWAFGGGDVPGNAHTIDGNDGDDLIIGDMTDWRILFADRANNSIPNVHNIDNELAWLTEENPMFGNSSIPHTTVLAEATAGEQEYYSLTIGAGQTITVDIDFGDHAIGTSTDMIVELLNDVGTVRAFNSSSDTIEGGLGSTSILDPFLTFTAATAGTYYIRVRPSSATNFAGGETWVMNVSVTGHAVRAAAPAHGNDNLNGGNGDDTIFGMGGDDTINGGEGSDTIHGGSGNNIVHGDGGDDLIYSGGSGSYFGDDGNDRIVLAPGSLSGATHLDGGAGIDALEYTYIQGGALFINLATGATGYFDGDFFGGPSVFNFENLVSGVTWDTVTGTNGANVIDTGGGNDTVDAGGGNDTVHGGDGDDTIKGDGGNDALFGGNGNDGLDGGAGGDWMEGGAGDDVYFVDDAGDSIVEHSGAGTDEVRTVFAVASLLGSHVENLTSNANVSHDFRGSALNNVIRGGAQRDMIRLQDGGNDSAIAGAGNDTIYFGGAFTALDTVDGGAGVDAIILQGDYRAGVTLGSGSVSNISGLESISLAPGHFADWGDTAGNFYDYRLTAIDANVPAGGILRINGHHLRSGEDFMFNGVLEQDGRFFLFGGLGVDHFTGGSGNDIFVFGHDGRFGQTDVLHGGPGYDSIYLRGDYDLDFTQNGFGIFTGIESITLGWASDTQFVVGGDGEFDYRIVWKDSMIESGVRITVNGSGLAANETMVFDASDESGGHFRLFGGAANDTITGGGGDDLIYGGLGWDTLVGNGGSDTFVYYDTAESSITPGTFDQINGFTHLVDKIDLSVIDANSILAGDQAFTFIGNAMFSGAGQLRTVQLPPSFGTNNWQVEADTNGDGTPDLLIRVTVEAGESLTAADFFL